VADQDDMDNLLTLLAAATSFHDALYVRDLFGLKRADANFRLTGTGEFLPDLARRLLA
jgi:ethanolamine ammonia-lyase large subunit